MHELSLCQGIVQVLETQAETRAYRRVRRVWLEIGALAGVDCEALRCNFELVARGTLAEGALLDIALLPGEAWCFDCARGVEIGEYGEPCPHCGGYRLRTGGGDQLRIKEIEVE